MPSRPPESYDSAEYDAAPSAPVSARSRGVALVLGCVGGVFGLHRFYVGKVQTGILQLFTLGGLGVWWLYDMVLLVAGDFRDGDDLPLRNWQVGETRFSASSPRRMDEMEERLEMLRTQVSELAERLDFAERMLAQQRERGKLGAGS